MATTSASTPPWTARRTRSPSRRRTSGCQPAVYTDAEGNEVQPFDGIYTDAFAFFDSLTAEQLATLTSGDVSMCAPGDTCDFTTGAGLTGADLTDEQKQLLLDLVANWAGMADEETTATTLAEIEATLDDTVVSWSGETTVRHEHRRRHLLLRSPGRTCTSRSRPRTDPPAPTSRASSPPAGATSTPSTATPPTTTPTASPSRPRPGWAAWAAVLEAGRRPAVHRRAIRCPDEIRPGAAARGRGSVAAAAVGARLPGARGPQRPATIPGGSASAATPRA